MEAPLPSRRGGTEPPSVVMGWGERAERFAQRVVLPAVPDLEKDGGMPRSVLEGLAKEGFLGLTLPREYGGSEVDGRTFVEVLRPLARASLAVATLVAVHHSVAAAPIQEHGSPAQKERYLPAMAKGEILGAFALTEPSVGSDAQRLTTRYSRVPAGFRLKGSKMFITNGASAGVVVAFATHDPSLASRGVSAFLVPQGTPGFSTAQKLDKLGLWGSETVELVFEDCELPDGALLGEEGRGFTIAMEALEGGRIGIAACSLGVAEAALEATREGLPDEPEPWQASLLARSFVEVEAARALVERAAAKRDAGEPFATEASAAKLYASQVAFRVASRGIDAVGRGAVDRAGANPLERLFRDARVLTIVEGTTEIQERILARALLAARPGRG